MKLALITGVTWALDTVILGIALSMAPYIGTLEALAFAAIVSSAFHDFFCAGWLFLYMLFRGKLKKTVAALKTKAGRVVVLGGLLAGPVGMTGYVMAIQNLGAGLTAIISTFYPAFGALMAAIILKERMNWKQVTALLIAICAIAYMSVVSADMTVPGNFLLGMFCVIMCVVGWGFEAVLCAWGMRDDAIDNEVALQLRYTTSALAYAVIVLPLFGAWGFAATAFPSEATLFIALAALIGSGGYILYYKAISIIGASRSMALNITYSAWTVFFSFLIFGTVPTVTQIVCCVIIFAGTVLAACPWDELFGKRKLAGNTSE